MKSDVRFDRFGKIRLMAQADGYAMVRRPHAMPFVLSFSEWLKLADSAATATEMRLQIDYNRVSVAAEGEL